MEARSNLPESDNIIYQELICGICSDLLEEPKVLVCAHLFCKDCLNTLHKGSCKSPSTGLQYDIDSDAGDNYCGEGPAHSNEIECPYCSQITVFPDEHSGLKTSLPPEKTIMVKDEAEHLKMVKGNWDLSPEVCRTHEMQHQYFCIDCNVTACVECINSVHALHQSSNISAFLVESHSQLQSLVQPACDYVSRADTLLRKLSQDGESIECNREMCKEAVYEVFNKVRTAIDEREKVVLSRVDSYIDQKLSRVTYQRKNLTEVQDQLKQNIQEIQQLLNSALSDVKLLMDKQRLVDDVDEQEQTIFYMENSVSNAMFSSTYIGFRDADAQLLKQQIDMFVTLCELYPEADTGYYSSRIIPVQDEEKLYVDTLVHAAVEESDEFCTGELTFDQNCCTKNVDAQNTEDFYNSTVTKLQRSQSTPSSGTKAMWQMKKRKNTTANIRNEELIGPSIPIRFDSLLMPTPILAPDKVFNKLTVSKMETVYPCGICVGENNSFIISDVKNHCLRIIASNGKFIGAIGKEGKGSGQFEEPCAVAANEKAQIFVCQRENPRIQKLTSGGKYIQKFGHKSLRGNTLGEPWGIAIGPDQKLFVTDWDKSCIHVFCNNGRYDYTIGNNDSFLKFPAGIAVNSSSNLIVADRGNHCVWVLKTDGSILMRIGTKGHGPGELFLPHGVAIHPDGSIIVSESGNHRISIFSSCGTFLQNFGRKGTEPGMFNYPRHVCVTPKGEIAVADELNQRLQLFKV